MRQGGEDERLFDTTEFETDLGALGLSLFIPLALADFKQLESLGKNDVESEREQSVEILTSQCESPNTCGSHALTANKCQPRAGLLVT